jgi:IclR family transcriptional regulator, mhp operon transcriptional activator
MDSTRPIRALTRGLDALTVLNLRNGATVSEVAQEIRLPRTTVYRILETLCESGFAFRDASDDRYRLAEAVKHLSDGFVDEDWITQVASPLIHELGREVVWPIAISTLSGSTMMVRETTDHLSPLAVDRYSSGFRFPLLTSASGRLYLALCGDEERAALLGALAKSNKPEAKLARNTAELDRILLEISSQGFATAATARRVSDDFSIAVPIHLDGQMIAGLGVRISGMAMPAKTAIERYLPKLRDCAGKITARLAEKKLAPLRAGESLV